MPTGAFTLYNSAKEYLMTTFQWETTAFYAVLLDGTHSDAATYETYGDVSGDKVTDADYGEVALSAFDVLPTGVGLTTDATKNVDAADVDFATLDDATISARWLAIVSGTPTSPATGDKLLGRVDLETTLTGTNEVSSTNGDFSLAWNAAGLFTVA